MGDLSLEVVLFLVLAALVAGFVDAVVGGGGLVQLPALLIGLPGASVVQIAATNKLASFCGTSISAATYVRRIRPDPRTFLPLMLAAGELTRLRFQGGQLLAAVVVTGVTIGFYDGAIGPGTGSFLVFALVGLLGYNFLEASAKAKLANWATNLAALAVFVPQGAVIWDLALVMAAANVTGGYLGARLAMARGARFVRAFFLVVVSGFVVRLGGQLLGWW